MFTVLICGITVSSDTFEISEFVKIAKTSFTIPLFFITLGILVAGITSKISSGMLYSIGVLI